ncbi:OTU deubiquitinase with linear linkage specificity a [Takifugu rubripes]|nr:protein YAE1 homolog [Takifugu rubripes]|eukprot:XP_011606324.1 PREDICTED: yae1 domain-containing protein 1 [Takifugu rubripes]
MSWLKAASICGDDVFDENADEMSVMSKEWASNMKKRIRDGYVDGSDAGMEASLQVGFKQGYLEGAAMTAPVGRLKGMLSALYFWYQTKHPENPIPPSVTELLHRVSQYEDTIIDGTNKALEKPTPNVSSVSETMEELDLEQSVSGCCKEGCNDKECCKEAKKNDLNVTNTQENLSSGSSESLSCLLQECIELFSEFGLPQELIHHMEELKPM